MRRAQTIYLLLFPLPTNPKSVSERGLYILNRKGKEKGREREKEDSDDTRLGSCGKKEEEEEERGME